MKKRSIKGRRKKDYGPNWPDGKDERAAEEPRRDGDKVQEAPYDAKVEAIREKVRKSYEARKAKLVDPDPPPNYDDLPAVIDWLDSLK